MIILHGEIRFRLLQTQLPKPGYKSVNLFKRNSIASVWWLIAKFLYNKDNLELRLSSNVFKGENKFVKSFNFFPANIKSMNPIQK